jgi:hypothetical protein
MHTFGLYDYNRSQLVLLGGCAGSSSSGSSKQYNFGDDAGASLAKGSRCDQVSFSFGVVRHGDCCRCLVWAVGFEESAVARLLHCSPKLATATQS